MKNFEILLKDMSHNTKYAFLEQGSDDSKLTEIASKFGVQLPANDLAIFKGTYAYIDRTNLNGCSLPEAEVTTALATLRGKAVDFDHLRKRVVGYFIDAEMEGDEIVCYGIFFKGNFPEDYEIIKQCMAEGKLGISFEAYGDHKMREDGDYDLVDIEFAGGALLIASDPAFPGAGVLELAKNSRVLEFAKVMTEPAEHIKEKVAKLTQATRIKQTKENASYDAWEFDMIMRALGEVEWHKGEEECWREVSKIDFTNNEVVVTYQPSGTEVKVNLTPSSEVTKKGNPDEIDKMMGRSFIESFQEFDGNFDELESFVQKEMDYKSVELPEIAQLSLKERTKLSDNAFAVIKKIKNVISGKRRKVRMFPLNDAAHVRIALARLEEDNVKDTFTQLGISYKTVQQRILNKAKELNMKDIMVKYEQATTDEQVELYARMAKEVASLKTQIDELTAAQETAKSASEEAMTAKDSELSSIQEKVDEITKAKDEVQTELDRRDEEIKQATLVSRKEALGDAAEGIEDADILDEVKYEMALLKKENAALKAAAENPLTEEEKAAAAVLKAAEKKDGTEDASLEKGSRQKDAEDDLKACGDRVLKRAYGDGTEGE